MSLVAEHMARSPEKSKEVIENSVFDELMYDDEVHNQRVVGYGLGVSRSQVFGLKVQLKNLAFATHDSALAEEFLALKQENSKLKENCTRFESFSNRVTMILARLGVDLDEEAPFMETNNPVDVEGVETRTRLENSILKDPNKNNNRARKGLNHKIKDNANTCYDETKAISDDTITLHQKHESENKFKRVNKHRPMEATNKKHVSRLKEVVQEPNKGKSNASLKHSSLLGPSLSDVLRCKSEGNATRPIKAQTSAAATLEVSKSTSEIKRKK